MHPYNQIGPEFGAGPVCWLAVMRAGPVIWLAGDAIKILQYLYTKTPPWKCATKPRSSPEARRLGQAPLRPRCLRSAAAAARSFKLAKAIMIMLMETVLDTVY